MRRVLVIGRREAADDEIPYPDGDGPEPWERESVYQKLSKPVGAWYSAVRWSFSPSDFIEVVKDLARFGPIDVLDILDHGAGGAMMMGQETLFLFEGGKLTKGEQMARQLACWLSQTAQVRLLGCKTACEAGARSGRGLLLALAQLLGENRIVFGTIERVRSTKHFLQERGFVPEQHLLYSSLAAIDHVAPSGHERLCAIDQNGHLLRTVESRDPWECACRPQRPPVASAAVRLLPSRLHSALDWLVRLTQRKPTS